MLADTYDPRNPENYEPEVICPNCEFDCSEFDKDWIYNGICPDCGTSLNQ